MRVAATIVVLLIAVGPVTGQEMKLFVKGSWTALRQAHQGQPLIVHFWGLTCPPCLGELPHWGELVKEHRGVPVIFVAADPVSVERDQIERTLASAGLQHEDRWVFGSEFVDPLRWEVSPDWAGELPLTLLIDKSGTTTTIVGVADLAVVRTWIAKQAPRSPGR